MYPKARLGDEDDATFRMRSMDPFFEGARVDASPPAARGGTREIAAQIDVNDRCIAS